MKIGSATGFTRSMVDILLKEAIKQGFKPEMSLIQNELVNAHNILANPQNEMMYAQN
ncbi:hypothetical protein DPMN_055523 [Dreissena polymorpha]|uniref:Uncharacterized protein n=1 Tax=Dreissena polymorpha TaxID=45954 RepID=A0A9D4HQQ6_DREPO|nr:hypothetical protein DPMN_055523 [Dreissena polymorpha]